MSIHLKATKLVTLLLISLLTITRSTDRYDIKQESLTFVNQPLVPVPLIPLNNNRTAIQEQSIFSSANRCFFDTFSNNFNSVTDFRSIYPYITILVAIVSLLSNPFLIFKFLFIKQTLPTLACTFLPVGLIHFVVCRWMF